MKSSFSSERQSALTPDRERGSQHEQDGNATEARSGSGVDATRLVRCSSFVDTGWLNRSLLGSATVGHAIGVDLLPKASRGCPTVPLSSGVSSQAASCARRSWLSSIAAWLRGLLPESRKASHQLGTSPNSQAMRSTTAENKCDSPHRGDASTNPQRDRTTL